MPQTAAHDTLWDFASLMPAVRERMVSGLMNVAPELAETVAQGSV